MELERDCGSWWITNGGWKETGRSLYSKMKKRKNCVLEDAPGSLCCGAIHELPACNWDWQRDQGVW